MNSGLASLWQSLVSLWHIHCVIASDPRGAFALLVGTGLGLVQGVGVVVGLFTLARHVERHPWYWW